MDTNTPAHRGETLDEAKRLTCGERDRSYGGPVENLADIAAMWTTRLICKYRGTPLTEEAFRLTSEDVAWMMTQMKDTRSWKSFKHDNYVDAAAYAAIAGECAFAALSEEPQPADEPEFAEGTTHRIATDIIDGRPTS